jgi:two-component SAPR family response regulator
MDCKVILVVDDDEGIFELLEQRLNSQFQVLRIPNGKRAIQLVEKARIDLVIISSLLPDMAGLEVLKGLKRRDPSVPVAMTADNPTHDFIISAFRAGCRDFIKKPLAEDDLIERVTRIVGQPLEGPEIGTVEASRSRKNCSLLFRIRLLTNTLLAILDTRFKNTLTILPNHSEFCLPEDQSDLNEKEQELDTNSMPLLRVYFLGKFRVVLNEQEIEHWPSRKGRAIFAYLAFNHKRRLYKDVLMDKFWPDSTPESARNCLNVALHGLRQIFQKVDSSNEYIVFKDECYFINPDIDIWLDVEEFLHYWRMAQSIDHEKGIEAALGEYELAAALYKGDFMEEDLYESWPALDRENLKEIYLVILDRLSKHYSLDGKPATAINLCETMLEKDNCREDIYQRLMRCYYRLNQRDKALKRFRKCVEILKAELEVEPSRATVEIYEQIKQDCLKITEIKEN